MVVVMLGQRNHHELQLGEHLMLEITTPGFTLRYLDPFQSRGARAYFGERCSRPRRNWLTRLNLHNFVVRGWML